MVTMVLSSSNCSCVSRTLMLWAMSWMLHWVCVCFTVADTLAVALRVRMRMLWCDSCIKRRRGSVAQWPLWRRVCIVLSICLNWIIHKVVLNALLGNLVAIVRRIMLWRIDLNVTERTCRAIIVTQVVPVMRVLMMLATSFSVRRQLILIQCWLLLILRFLGICCWWQLICTVDTSDCRRAWRCSHRYWVLLLWLHL